MAALPKLLPLLLPLLSPLPSEQCWAQAQPTAHAWQSAYPQTPVSHSAPPFNTSAHVLASDTRGIPHKPRQLSNVGAKELNCGYWHTCAIAMDDTSYCWGTNFAGELGWVGPDGPIQVHAGRPVLQEYVSPVSKIFGGETQTCAVRSSDGMLLCWGENSNGALGCGDADPTHYTAPCHPEGLEDVTMIVGRGASKCALELNGSVYCWGLNDHGQVGVGTSQPNYLSPQHVSLPTAIHISAERNAACAVTVAGAVYCWGTNTAGQLGTGDTVASSSPVLVQGIPPMKQVACAIETTCAITRQGAAYCWGAQNLGQTGRGVGGAQLTPQPVPDLPASTSIAPGAYHMCVVTMAGNVICWGGNFYGQLGRHDRDGSLLPQQVAGLEDIDQISTGAFHSCAKSVTGSLYCWGDATPSAVREYISFPNPMPVQQLPTATGVIVSDINACALTPSASSPLSCWGHANYVGSVVPFGQSFAAPVTSLSSVSAVSFGYRHACVITGTSVYCWGDNPYKEIEDSATGHFTLPHLVAVGGAAVSAISAGQQFTCAVTTTISLLCWGKNDKAQTGHPISTTVDTPTALTMPVGRTPLSVSAGMDHACVLHTDGTMSCWGSNEHGKLGIGSSASTPQASPQLVMTLTSVTKIKASHYNTCALLANLALYCWGFGGHGITLPGQSQGAQFSPVATKAGVNDFDMAFLGVCSIESNTVVCWGRNSQNNLGVFGPQILVPPTTIPGLPSVVSIAKGPSAACAVANNGSTYCWGSDLWAGLGTGYPAIQFGPALILRSLVSASIAFRHCWKIGGDSTQLVCPDLNLQLEVSFDALVDWSMVNLSSITGCDATSIEPQSSARAFVLDCTRSSWVNGTTVDIDGSALLHDRTVQLSPSTFYTYWEYCGSSDPSVQLAVTDSRGVELHSETQMSEAAYVYVRFGTTVANVNSAGILYNGVASSGIGTFTSVPASSSTVWRASITVATSTTHRLSVDGSSLVTGTTLANEPHWPGPSLRLALTNCSLLPGFTWPGPSSCVIWPVPSSQVSAPMVRPEGPLSVLVYSTESFPSSWISSTGIAWASNATSDWSSGSQWYMWWREVSAVPGTEGLVYLQTPPAPTCAQPRAVLSPPLRLAGTFVQAVSVVKWLAGWDGRARVYVKLETSGQTPSWSTPPPPSVALHRNGSTWACDSASWEVMHKLIVCQTEVLPAGSFTVSAQVYGQDLVASNKGRQPVAPVVHGVQPGVLHKATYAQSSRIVQFHIFGHGYGHEGDPLPIVKLDYVPCAQVARLSPTALSCSMRASSLASLSTVSASVTVVLPEHWSDADLGLTEAARSASLSSSVSIVHEETPPVGYIAPIMMSIQSAGSFTLQGSLYDDMTHAADLRVIVEHVSSVPSAVAGSFSIPAPGIAVPMPQFAVNTSAAAVPGKLNIGLRVLDDVDNSLTLVMTIDVLNNVPGAMSVMPNVTDTDSPYDTMSTWLCATAVFERAVVNISASDWTITAHNTSASPALPGWNATGIVLGSNDAGSGGTEFELCGNVSGLSSGTQVRFLLPGGAGRDASDPTIPSAKLHLVYMLDTQAPTMPGTLCYVEDPRTDRVVFAAGVPIRCTMKPGSVHDDVTSPSAVYVDSVSLVGAGPGDSISLLQQSLPVALQALPVLVGLVSTSGSATVRVALRDTAGNVAMVDQQVTVWDPWVWQPTLSFVTPSVLPASGGRIQVHGSNFTVLSVSVDNVSVGGMLCSAVMTVSDELVECTAPAGLGGGLVVRVGMAAGVESVLLDAVSYAVPQVTGAYVAPGSSFTLLSAAGGGPVPNATATVASQRIYLTCSVCGQSNDTSIVSGVWVGGQACGAVQRELNGTIHCALGVSQHVNLALWSTATGSSAGVYDSDLVMDVVLCIVGQCSTPMSLPVLGAPTISSISLPTTSDGHHLVTPGSAVSVSGWNLGRAQSDIVAVTVGGVACPAVQFLSSKSLLLTMPADAVNSTREHMPVVVYTAAGWQSTSHVGMTLSIRAAYQEARKPNEQLVSLSIARRSSNQAAWAVRIVIPADPVLGLVPPTGIALRWRDAELPAEWSSTVTFSLAGFAVVASSGRQLSYGDATVSMEGSLSSTRLPPTAVEVSSALVSAGGQGPWSSVTALVPAALPSQAVVQLHAQRVYGQRGQVDVIMDVRSSAELQAFGITQFRVYYSSLGRLRSKAGWELGGDDTSLLAALHGQGGYIDMPADELTAKPMPAGAMTRYTARLYSMSDSPLLFTAAVTTAAGSVQSAEVSSVLYDACSVNQYVRTELLSADPDLAVCASCPRGAWCGGGLYSTLQPMQGWYRIQWTPYALSLEQCAVPEACPGVPGAEAAAAGANLTAAHLLSLQYSNAMRAYQTVGADAAAPGVAHQTRCANGHSGTLCRLCDVGYSRSTVDGTCRACGSFALHVFLLLLAAALVVVGLGYLILSTIRVGLDEDATLTSGLKKLLISHNQQVSLAVGFRFAWPAAVSGLLEVMDRLSNMSDSVVATDCLVQRGGLSSFRLRIIGVLLAPWLVYGVICGLWMLAHQQAKHGYCERVRATVCGSGRAHTGTHAPDLRSDGDVAAASDVDADTGAHAGADESGAAGHHLVVDPGRKISHGHLAHWSYVKQYMVVSLVIVCFALHTSVTKAALRQFSCITLANDPTERQVLADDYDVQCTSSDNVVWLYGLGIPGFVLYGLGMPALLWWLVWRHRQELQNPAVRSQLGFLYASYRPHAWYFEPVIMLRKALLAVVSVNLAPMGLSMQTYTAILLLFTALLIHMNLRPMASQYLQRMEQMSLVISVLTLLGGLFLSASDAKSMAVLVSIVIVFSNAGFMLYLVGKLVMSILSESRRNDLARRWAGVSTRFTGGESSPRVLVSTRSASTKEHGSWHGMLSRKHTRPRGDSIDALKVSSLLAMAGSLAGAQKPVRQANTNNTGSRSTINPLAKLPRLARHMQ